MMVVLRHYSSRTEAEIVRGLLEAHQVPCKVKADDAGGMRPEMNLLWSVALLVDEVDLLKAKKILAITTGQL